MNHLADLLTLIVPLLMLALVGVVFRFFKWLFADDAGVDE